MNSDARNECSHPLGFPIRKSPDHSLLAASRGLSQLTTSFFAFLRLGIHTHALSSLTITSTSYTHLNATSFALTLVPATLLPSAEVGLPYNARQYSIVKDLDCSSNRFLRNEPNWVLSWQRIADFSYRFFWWAWVELNHRPHPYQGCALAI
jgi:hypothetical protein